MTEEKQRVTGFLSDDGIVKRERPELLLIDLGSVFWAAWHSSATDELSAARDRSLAQVRKLVADRSRDCVAICCDSPRSWRKEKHESYKANRPEKDKAAIGELNLTKERLRADGLLLWEADGFEADDVIATACRLAAPTHSVLIASADKDLLSCVNDGAGVRALSTKTGSLLTEADVLSKLGVVPWLVRDWLALVGDSSDGVEGVPGVGAKRAAELLNAHGSVEGIYEAIDAGASVTTGKIRLSLLESRMTVAKAIELVTLRADAPIDFSELTKERAVKPLVKENYMDHGDPEEDGRNEPVDEGLPPLSPPPKSEPEKPSTALAVSRVEPSAIVPVSFEHGLEPTSINGAYKLATGIYNSRLYSRFPNPEAIWAIVIRGREMGLGALTALDTFHIVEGRPTMHASLVIGLVLKSGLCEYFDLVESTRERAEWVTKRKGSSRETKLAWTIEDAHAANLVEKSGGGDFRGISRSGKPSNWDKYRRTMLRWRAGTELARAVYPDVTAGIYTPDELADGAAPENLESPHAAE